MPDENNNLTSQEEAQNARSLRSKKAEDLKRVRDDEAIRERHGYSNEAISKGFSLTRNSLRDNWEYLDNQSKKLYKLSKINQEQISEQKIKIKEYKDKQKSEIQAGSKSAEIMETGISKDNRQQQVERQRQEQLSNLKKEQIEQIQRIENEEQQKQEEEENEEDLKNASSNQAASEAEMASGQAIKLAEDKIKKKIKMQIIAFVGGCLVNPITLIFIAFVTFMLVVASVGLAFKNDLCKSPVGGAVSFFQVDCSDKKK